MKESGSSEEHNSWWDDFVEWCNKEGKDWHREDHDADWHHEEDSHEDWGDKDEQSWTPKSGSHESHSGEDDDHEHGRMKMKIIIASVVATVVLLIALVVIIVVCCKAKAKRAAAAGNKKNPFKDPETTKPSAKEIEAMQSAPPMMHTLPVVVKPVVVVDSLPPGKKGEGEDYTAPPTENPREQMAVWSPPPAYVEGTPKVD